ncbi:aminodeoxychorismate lyase [Pseudalkalibacillus sp. SCS-8]|uniref:aminodeoxychorismate lyase n=1 Tax=Pseudalkalibacillus nanhaiensis TaxID=3115291 RepID=UPI0032DBB86F
MFIYLNGDIVKDKEAAISPFDYGYLYGIGFFESFRIYDGHPFLLDDHLDRLNKALQEVHINQRFTRASMQSIIERLLNVNGWQHASFRLSVTAGKGEPALRTLAFEEPTILVYGGPLPEAPMELQEKKASVLTIRRNSPEGSERWKSHHFLNNLLAKQEIGNPAVEGIFLDQFGHVAEGITSNIFWVKGNTVYTPSVDTGILNGITRQYVLSLCEKRGITVEIGRYPLSALLEAEEIFMTNSVQEITGIHEVDGSSFPGKAGQITNELFKHYTQDRNELWTRNG